ncbi:MAG TPA: peptide chain release factor N(5)-glutamine methyltransferase [Vicinamibacterales bacterium]|jgi:release factor glutamine methyltransferase|nr:peptide chain release factor N(5)-glutamine methyltransferase [Vicinamibacterales bacterium]
MPTVHSRIAAARQRLRDAGLSSREADLAARVLAEHALGWAAERLLTDGGDAEPADFASRFDALVARRAAREPLPYIVGHREFWNLDFEVTPAVLIPRPETELIVEAALDIVAPGADATIADLCTGCGCVAIALARERPLARVIATDISEGALAVARRNARRLGVADRIEILNGDLLEPITGTCDVIVANPPYVAAGVRPALQPEVRDHEPNLALFGGDDGLGMIERLVRDAPARIRAGGSLVFEFGFGQDEEIEQMIAQSRDLTLIDLKRDLQGIARTAITRRR